jgi:hypothetical protein
MTAPIKLPDILEGMGFQSDESQAYLHTRTGDVVSVTMEELRAAEEEAPLAHVPAWQHDAMRSAGKILETEHYLPLSDRFTINEYRTSDRWEDLCHAIRGRGAFRRFKDRVQAMGWRTRGTGTEMNRSERLPWHGVTSMASPIQRQRNDHAQHSSQ